MIFPVADLLEFAVIASSHQVYQQSGKPDDKTRCDRNKQTQKDKQEGSPDRRVDGKDIEISRQVNVDLAALTIDDRISDPVILPPGQKPYRQIDRLFIAIFGPQELLQFFRFPKSRPPACWPSPEPPLHRVWHPRLANRHTCRPDSPDDSS